MIPGIIIVISFILDGILTNFLPYMVGDLSFFTPMLTLISLFLIYPFFYKKEKKYYLTAFILGFTYDLFFSNLLFLDAILFLLLSFVIEKVYKNLEISYLKMTLYIIGVITLYESMIAILIVIWNLVPMTFMKLIYKCHWN